MNAVSQKQPGSVPRRDWTKGNILKNLWLLSWPVIVLGVLYSVNLILEMIWVGRLGSAAIAGVGISGFIVFLVIAIKNGLGAGERALVARYVGGGDMVSARQVAGQAFVIATVYGLLVTAIGLLFAQPIFSLFNLAPEAVAEGVVYLKIIMAGWLTEAFWMTSFYVMQASGDTITPMKIAIIIRVVNAVLCPFLVLGWWVFPSLGVSGAAITYIIATGLGMLLCLGAFFYGKTRIKLTLSDFYPNTAIIRRILRIGLPASISGLSKAFGDLIVTSLMIPFGTLALAAHNLLSRIELFINTPVLGFGTGASVLVGQNLGARQPAQAAKSGWSAAGLISAFMITCAVIILIWAEKIIGLFNVEPDLVTTGSTFLRIAVTGYLGMCFGNILQQCITGSGDTLPPMIISMTMLWVVQLPLAFLFTRYTDLGAIGIRWAIVISFVAGAIAYTAYFRGGRWQRKRV
ncbi:MAG TPA: MATE family efflux transporter [Dehalococcoidales bacterium]|nr:MATE family efflux transporter [Dehalococcoidales bacterium]